jgi:hypothetical protein
LLLVLEGLRHNPGASWGLVIVGVIGLAAGLPLVIWPRKSNEVLWKATQAVRPWPVVKSPYGVAIAVGCLLLLLALAMFYGAWATL